MNIVCDTIRTYIGLNPPVPVKILESWVLVEESTVPTAHVSVADHPPLPNSNGAQVLQAVHEPPLINPVRQGPVLFRHDFVVTFGRREILCSGLPSCQLCPALNKALGVL